MPGENKKAVLQQENLSSDVLAFCALVARILMRCLREKHPQIKGLFSQSSPSEEQETGGTHDAA